MARNKKVYGIVLSGGGARGIAHIGVLAALERYGISPEYISGSSMGSLVGVFYAAGKKPEDMLEMVRNEKVYKLFNWSLPRHGMLSLKYIHKLMEDKIGDDSFEGLKKKLFIATSNLTTGESVIFSSGPLFQPAIASASIPVVFEPQVINGETYVDGGLFNDLPVEPLVNLCDHIIASHVNYNGPEPQLESIKEIAERVYRLAVYQNVKKNFAKCDYIINPPELRTHGIFDFKHLDELYEIGFKATEKVILKMPDHKKISQSQKKPSKF
jgi:NTE family protein